ncbi:MAG: hypothetical protein MZU84_05895 [Sphingobacterium sp.]|nr:hypothetical protein [Sphingobacterium sp.]
MLSWKTASDTHQRPRRIDLAEDPGVGRAVGREGHDVGGAVGREGELDPARRLVELPEFGEASGLGRARERGRGGARRDKRRGISWPSPLSPEFPLLLHYDALEMGIATGPAAKMANVVFGLAAPLSSWRVSRPFLRQGEKTRPSSPTSSWLALGTDREPGAAVLVQKSGRFLYIGRGGRGHAGHAPDRQPDQLPAGLGLEIVHRGGRHAARSRRPARLRGHPYGDLPRLPRLRPDDHRPPPPATHLGPARLRGPHAGPRPGPSPWSRPRSTTPGSSGSTKKQPAGWFAPGALWRAATQGMSCSASSSKRSRARPSPASCGTASSSR